MNENASTIFQQGRICHAAGDFAGAVAFYGRAAMAAPGDAAPRLALGAALHDMERFDEAVRCYDALLQQYPQLGEAWHNRGNTLLALGRYQEAIDSFERAVAILPNDFDALVASGTALERLGRRAAALDRYRAVVARDPQCAEAHWNLALALLAEGEYIAGWEEFAWRWRKKGYPSVWRDFPQPVWDGSSLDGRTIVLHAEQAFGDTLQFVRYLPLVAASGGRVVLECPDPLMALLAGIEGVAHVVATGQPLPPFDCHLPLLSLPGIFQTTVMTIPREIPYLRIPEERRDRWQQRLAADHTFKVGLVWAGRRWPDPFRACRLDDFAPLAAMPGVTFYSLQIGEGSEQAAIPPVGMKLVDLTTEIHDFADTAALVSGLDLVVSIDTAVAHLAGGLGKPVFLLVPFAPDWRWWFDDPGSSWYPTMSIFRQENLGCWREPVTQVRKMLGERVANAQGQLSALALQPCSDSLPPLRIFCYQSGTHYLLTQVNTYPNIHLVPLAAAIAAGHEALVAVTDPAEADFILFPEYLDAMLDNVGVAGTRQFISGLPYFATFEQRHIFYSNHDNSVPFGFSSVFFQVSINRLRHDPHAVAVPYPPQWISVGAPGFDLEKIRYLVSFNGNIASSLLRAELVLAVLKEERLSVFADPIPAFHCHLSQEQQQERKSRYQQTLIDSLTILCPRGEGLNSIRFFETLATGRIPVLVSDSCLLPYEEEIDYENCIFRIAEADIPRAGLLLADWIAACGPERLLAMCRRAREVWDGFLSAKQVVPLAIAALRKIMAEHSTPQLVPTEVVTSSADARAVLREWAITLHERGDFDAAGAVYDRLIAQHPADAELLYLRGTLDLQLGNLGAAIVQLEQAVRLSPGKAAYAMHLAVALNTNRQYADAEQLLRSMVASSPDWSDAWLNLGVTLKGRNQLHEALSCFRRAEALAPQDPRAPQNAAAMYQALGQFDDAERFLMRALILRPGYGTALWNLALLRLLRGDYLAGFADFDARFIKADPVPHRHVEIPEWDGSESLESLLVWDEQGFGDVIQCARYLSLVRKRVGKVYFECQSPVLVDLVRTVAGVDGVFSRGETLPACALQIPVMSLPRLLGTTLATIPGAVPYVTAPAEQVACWQAMLPGGVQSIGLVWRGNPKHDNDGSRSCSISAFTKFIEMPGKQIFVSLQLQPTPDEIITLRKANVIDVTERLRSFADTAALVTALDLVITVDTAVAHLAGALGKSVWLLLPFVPDWRWGLDGDTTPWYPTMRLFRQPSRGDWSSVMAEVQQALVVGMPYSDALPHSPNQHLERAASLREREAWEEALACYEEVLTIAPGNSEALLGAGGVLNFLNRHQESAERYRQIIRTEPDNIPAHVNLGMSLLAQGEFQEGWRELEWRLLRVRDQLPPIPLLTPDDCQAKRLAGKTVLLHTEQGYGDTIQFVRYTAMLAQNGACVVVNAQPELTGLLGTCPGVSRVIPHGELLPAADFQVAMQSLPHLFATEISTIPAEVPYLYPDPGVCSIWQARMAGAPGLKVGLFWQGRQMGLSGYHRSLSMTHLQALARIPHVRFFSLQVGEEGTRVASSGMPMVELGSQIRDFTDTAAIIADLDLVISIDTSVAHLAGALGKPTWTMLLHAADWRWLTGRDDSPWYPTMRLFRQVSPGDWDGVIARVAQALTGEVTSLTRVVKV